MRPTTSPPCSERATDAELAVARLQGQRQFEAWLPEFTAEGGIAGSAGIAQAVALGERYGVQMPIAREVAAVIAGSTGAEEAVARLMGRALRAERD